MYVKVCIRDGVDSMSTMYDANFIPFPYIRCAVSDNMTDVMESLRRRYMKFPIKCTCTEAVRPGIRNQPPLPYS